MIDRGGEIDRREGRRLGVARFSSFFFFHPALSRHVVLFLCSLLTTHARAHGLSNGILREGRRRGARPGKGLRLSLQVYAPSHLISISFLRAARHRPPRLGQLVQDQGLPLVHQAGGGLWEGRGVWRGCVERRRGERMDCGSEPHTSPPHTTRSRLSPFSYQRHLHVRAALQAAHGCAHARPSQQAPVYEAEAGQAAQRVQLGPRRGGRVGQGRQEGGRSLGRVVPAVQDYHLGAVAQRGLGAGG